MHHDTIHTPDTKDSVRRPREGRDREYRSNHPRAGVGEGIDDVAVGTMPQWYIALGVVCRCDQYGEDIADKLHHGHYLSDRPVHGGTWWKEERWLMIECIARRR